MLPNKLILSLLLFIISPIALSDNNHQSRMMGSRGEITTDQKKLRLDSMSDKEKKEMNERYQKRLNKMSDKQIEKMHQRQNDREKFQQERAGNMSRSDLKKEQRRKEHWLSTLTLEQRKTLEK